MPKVIIHNAVDQSGLDLLASRADLAVCEVGIGQEDELRREIVDADGIILRYLPLGAEALRAARQLKVVARHGVGYDNVDIAAANECGIPVATVGDANAVTVAELTLYMMLAIAKRGFHYDRAVREGNFGAREVADHAELYTKNMLIIGFGRIGTRVARRCQAFDMNVYVCDPYIPQETITAAGCHPVPAFADVLGDMDIVSVHVPLNDETRHMINTAVVERMKPGAILVNAARGPIIDGAAVAASLDSGRLRGVGLDVFEPEPPATDDPLLRHPATVLTPHMGGSARECFRRMATICAQNVLDALDGKLDRSYVVNPEVLG